MQSTSESSQASRYWAFISYSSKDRSIAKWLHKRIENYSIPKEFQTVVFPDGSSLGKYLRPVFRDRDELSGAADLGPAISKALSGSRYLIVLCSKNAARSEWVNKEIVEFRASGKSGNILALILDGEPNATSNPSISDDEECFPPALRSPAEPLAGDLRKSGDGPERGFLKVLAGMAQLDFDALYRRHERAQRFRRLVFATVSVTLTLSLASLSAVALFQRNRAEQQTDRAQKNEHEAKLQRDLARSNLATFYREKARFAGSESANSLAWALKAAETNPKILDSDSFQGQLAHWIGPFPGPDKCSPTGLKPSNSFSDNQSHHLSREHRRILVQGTDSSWSLMNWDGGAPLATGFTKSPIRYVIAPETASWFALVGFRQVEILAWSDGRNLGSHHFGKEEIDCAASTATELLLGVSAPSDGEAVSRIHSWNPLEQEVPTETGPVLGGQIQIITAATNGDTTRLYVCSRTETERSNIYLARTLPNNQWEPVSPGDKVPESYHFTIPDDRVPEGVIVWSKGMESHTVTDLTDQSRNDLEMATGEYLVGLRRGPSSMEAVVQTEGEGSIEVRNLEDSSRTTLFEGQAMDRSILDPNNGTVISFNYEAQTFHISDPTEKEKSFSFNPPMGLMFQPLSIHPVSERLVLASGYMNPSNHRTVALIDLNAEGDGGIFMVRIPQMEDWLEASIDDNGLASMRILSHDRCAISTISALPDMRHLSNKLGESSHLFEGRPLHLKVSDEGIPEVLSWREAVETPAVRHVSPSRESEWISIEGMYPDGNTVTEVGSSLLLQSFSHSMLIDASGKSIWREEHQNSKLLKVLPHGEDQLLLFQDSLDVSLLASKSGKKIWSRKFEDSIDSIHELADPNQVLIVTTSRSIDGKQPAISLRKWNLLDGTESEIWSTMVEKLEVYGTTIEILGTSPPAILVNQQAAGGDLHECVIYMAVEKSLVERMRWQRPAFVESVSIPSGNAFVVDTSDARNQLHEATFLKIENGEITRIPIPLPASLVAAHPDPTGKRCLFVLQDSMFLWDVATAKPIGGLISLGEEHGTETRPGALYRPLWSTDGEFLFLTYNTSIYQLSGRDGELIRVRSEHRPSIISDGEQVEIERTALSPNGEWLASADASGSIRLSRFGMSPFDLESLRRFTRQSGGRVITGEKDLVPWSP
jgi:WD40 repeat protein